MLKLKVNDKDIEIEGEISLIPDIVDYLKLGSGTPKYR